ncbi:vascular endothelial growth factor receptor 1 isoform X2 [Cherax quadricarinatus]
MKLSPLTLLVLLLLVSAAWSSLAPRLNVSDELVVHTSQRYFSLRCEGTEPLQWNTTGQLLLDDAVITSDTHPGSDYPYSSTFTVNDLYTADTGYYYCFYAGMAEESGAKTYVYLHDGVSGFVHSGAAVHSIQVTTADKLVIGCRTTLPNITVALKKESEEISSVEWDPRIGFVFHNIAVKDTGIYVCSSSFLDELNFFVQVEPSTNALPKPAVDKEPNQHFVQGQGFKLTCSLISEKEIAFHWTLPNPSTSYSTAKSSVSRKESNYKTSTLHVLNATKEDSGHYNCKVTADLSKPNDDSFEVIVQDSIQSFINITSSIEKIKMEESQPLKWKTLVHTYPTDPVLVYRNWRKLEIKESSRITTEHHASSAESWLKISNVTADDFGFYTLEGITSDKKARDNATVFVEVKSKPTAMIRGASSYVNAGKTLEVSCSSQGFPLPISNWLFKACPNGPHICDEDYKTFEYEDRGNSTSAPGNRITFSIAYRPHQSGILLCDMKNLYGSKNATVDVIMSDIGGNYVFKYTVQNKISQVYQNKTLTVIVNDDFYLMCGASKFSYSKVQLSHSAATNILNDLNILANETSLSKWNYIKKDEVTMDLEGNYTCKAVANSNRPSKVIVLRINVLSEEPVKFTDSANMHISGGTVSVKENQQFSFNCTVTGTPTPVITWFKDSEPLQPGSDFINNETVLLKNKNQTLMLRYVFEAHVGRYSCMAENRKNSIVGFLTLTVPKAGLSTPAKISLVLACLGIIILVAVVFVLFKRVKKERKFRKSFRKNELYLFEKGNICQLNPDCTADEQAELLPYDQEWEVPREDIKIGKQLGSGAFGRVVKAVVTGLDVDGEPTTTVAVKMCKSQADPSQVRALALELKIMLHLGKHLNIVNLMGANTVNIGKGELWILVEYCHFGNLLAFMHRHRKNFINQINPATDRIDPTQLVMDPSMSLLSLGQRGYPTGPITDQDGYLAPNVSKFSLTTPPRASISSPPQSPTSMTGSCKLDGTPRQVMDNPMYHVGLKRSVSDCPEDDLKTNSSSGGSQIPRSRDSRLHSTRSNTNSDIGSIGYCKNDLQITNTDMTTVQSPMSPSLLSPSEYSQLGLDSQGNPFSYDIGNIPGVNAPFTTSVLICWAWQVAQGMDYLTRRKVLHGDLAARNLLLSNDNVVKISDFGLSREMYKKDVYMKKGDDLMPIKWMSVEAVRDRIFSVQSDVWAFGVTLWEIFSLGSTPYPGIEVNKDFLELLENGYRMDKPKYANQEIYTLLLQCWEMEPMNRPNFARSAEHLGVLMLPDLKGQYVAMNDPYLVMNEERFRTGTDYLDMLSSPDFDNLQREDEDTKRMYLNLKNADGNTEDNYLNMKSPDLVGYSRVGVGGEPTTGVSNPHYLPMNSTRGTPSPMVDVFSPRPNEIPRFTFGQGAESSRLTELPEEDESALQDISKDTNDQSSEKSSLINAGTKSPSEGHLSNLSQHNSENEDPLSGSINNGEVTYVNLPYYEST